MSGQDVVAKFDVASYAKILLHGAKHPTCPVMGLLMGSRNGSEVITSHSPLNVRLIEFLSLFNYINYETVFAIPFLFLTYQFSLCVPLQVTIQSIFPVLHGAPVGPLLDMAISMVCGALRLLLNAVIDFGVDCHHKTSMCG